MGLSDVLSLRSGGVNQNSGKSGSGMRALRSPAGAAAVVLCAAACASSTGTGGTAATGGGAPPHSTAQANSGSGTAAELSAPGAVLSIWLKQIVAGRYTDACADMAKAASAAPTPTPLSTAQCASTLAGLHENFVTDGIKPASAITVDKAKVAGASATVDGKDVHVDGSTLTGLMVAHSTGVQPGQLSITFTLTQIGGAWHVTDLNLDI
jgi:hypothetical protein